MNTVITINIVSFFIVFIPSAIHAAMRVRDIHNETVRVFANLSPEERSEMGELADPEVLRNTLRRVAVRDFLRFTLVAPALFIDYLISKARR